MTDKERGKYVKIAACIMTKNEEANIAECLQSLNGIVDEVFLVDTGSVDHTMDIARLYGANVYEHPWQNNFSLHRNQSIQYATDAGYNWLIIIDADERIVKAPEYRQSEFKKWLKEEIDDKGYKSIAFFVNDYQGGQLAMSCNSARMFKAGHIHYENCIHNQPIFEGACVLNHWFTLSHYGYDLSPEQMRKKFFRTKGLLYKEMRDNPSNQDIYFYLCQLYGHHNFDEKSRYWGEKYLAMRDEIPPDKFNSTIFFTLIRNYQESGDLERAMELMQEAMKEHPYDPDLASAMADHGAMVKDNRLMAEGARRYITGFEEMAENPAKKGGQFYFSLTNDVLTLNLYRLTIASLEEGLKCWQSVKQYIPTMHQSLKDELVTNLNIIGLPHLLNEIPELVGSTRQLALDIREVEV